jgi:hypothetical protein
MEAACDTGSGARTRDDLKANLMKRRIKAPKRSSCALCKPHKRGWNDKKNPGELRIAVKHSQELREHGLAG